MRSSRLTRLIVLGAGLALVAGRAATAAPAAGLQPSEAAAVATALRVGDLKGARDKAADGLQRNPHDARLQFLNGLAYHLTAEAGDAAAYDLARVGYESSLRFDPNDFWADYMLGVLEFERGAWRKSQERFAAALLQRPDDARALAGLAAASYYAGDASLASLAGERAAAIAPGDPEVLKIAAMGAAAGADPSRAERYLAAFRAAGGRAPEALAARIGHLSRTAALDAVEPAVGAPPLTSAPPDQMLAEVTIILTEDTRNTGRGLNLLDGLRLQFGYENTTEDVSGHPLDTFQRTVTHRIALPEVDYNLNIFNRSGENYHVLARPTLSAYLGEPSEFFAGRVISVQVSGVNLSTLQSVDAGVSLKLTPQQMEGDRVKFRIEATRSFFSPLQFGSFPNEISVFKQQVAATAELDYGQTLILSGLSETVYDGTRNDTPGVADIPVVRLLFSRHDVQARQTSVLILVTPLRPVAMALPRRLDREGAAAKVAELWASLVDPQSDAAAIADRLSHARVFSRAESGDIAVESLEGPAILGEALAAADRRRP